MKYVMAFGTSDRRTRRVLEDGSTRQSLAEDCRDAALSFMSGVAVGWDKLDLALWLTGPYARATRHAVHGERVAAVSEAENIPDETIEALVTRVRGQLLASIEKAALEFGALDFAAEVVERGFVRKVVDADGRDAWIPVDGARMRLRDRLRSLFTADYLNAPYTYAELFVCHRCEAVVFDDRAKQLGICGSHRISGVVPRDDRAHDDETDDEA
ncbi:MAG: hypothetical protein JWP87_1655 [Labilithrix sp.]|nr:hypothetical protein [Labilithrix sp.]